MAVGLMILPATAARFWSGQIGQSALLAGCVSMASGAVGLLLSFHLQWPSGPAIVLVAGAFYVVSVIAGRRGGLLSRRQRGRRHRAA